MDYFHKSNLTASFASDLNKETFSLFYNQNIRRKLNREFIDIILSNLEKEKKIEFKDANRDGFLVYKFSPDKIAHEIYEWVKRAGKWDRVETIFWLTTGDDTENELFHNMPEEIMLKSVKILEGQGKAQLITIDARNFGVKFL